MQSSYKMNVFLYGPKSDPYHLGLWDEDYPETVSEEDSKNGVMDRGMRWRRSPLRQRQAR